MDPGLSMAISGSAGPLRGSKGTSFEGVREPFVARWPKRIPAGSVACADDDNRPVAYDAGRGAELPKDRLLTGAISGLYWKGSARGSTWKLYFYWGYELHAVRSGKWKL
jgi:arylsulfatase